MDLFQQIASNKRRSTALLILLLVLLAAFLGVLGGAYGSWEAGVAIAVVVGVVAFLVAWFGGSAILLTISGAKEIQRTDKLEITCAISCRSWPAMSSRKPACMWW